MNSLHHAPSTLSGETSTMKKLKLIALALGATVVAIAACTAVTEIHDYRLGMQPDELHKAVPMDSSEEDAFLLLQALAAKPPNNTNMYVFPPETVTQPACSPPPCSSTKLDVPVGFHLITARVAITGHWSFSFCLDEYIAHFIFDEDGDYYDFVSEDILTCL